MNFQSKTTVSDDQLANIPAEMAEAPRWVCWRIEERNGSLTKVPVNPSSQGTLYSARSNDHKTWGTLEDAVACCRRHVLRAELGIGFMLGDGWCGVDLDHVLSDQHEFGLDPKAAQVMQAIEMAGYTERSPSGDGLHVIMDCDKPSGFRSTNPEYSLEFYGKGRYFTVTCDPFLPGSRFGDCEDAATAVCERFLAQSEPAERVTVANPSKGGYSVSLDSLGFNEGIESYARSIMDGEWSSSGGRNNHMFRVCGHLHKKSDDLREVRDWAHRINLVVCSPPLEESEVDSLVLNAKSNGTPPVDSERPESGQYSSDQGVLDHRGRDKEDSDEAARRFVDRARAKQKEVVDMEYFEGMPGFIGEYLNQYRLGSEEYLPELGLAGALNALSVIVGGEVEGPGGCTPNVYTVGIAPSGAGKDYCRKMTSDVLYRAGLDNRVGPSHLSSGEGFVAKLANDNITLFQLDECAEMMAEGKNAGNVVAQRISKFLKEAYSESGRPWQPNCKADAKANVMVAYPYPVVYFTTTPNRFWESFAEESVGDGFLGRLMVFEQDGYVRRTPGVTRRRPQASDAMVSFAEGWQSVGDIPNELKTGTRREIPWSAEAEVIINDFAEEVAEVACDHRRADSGTPIWIRSRDRIIKVATLLACSRGGPSEVTSIGFQDAQAALDLVKALTYRVIRRVKNDLVTHEHSRVQKRIMDSLGKGDYQKGQISRKVQGVGKRERNAALEDLIESREVRIYRDGETGKEMLSANLNVF